jgi:hypothetical protein
MDQVSIKYTNIFNCKTLKNFPKLGFLVWNQTIWQPWSQVSFSEQNLHPRRKFQTLDPMLRLLNLQLQR